MTFGVALLVHENLYRARQLVLALARNGIPVAIHLDAKVPASKAAPFMAELDHNSQVHFTDRRDCGWGRWSLVEAEIDASNLLLRAAPEITHVALLSGSCLPLQPLPACKDYLARHPGEDFIESFRVGHEPWGAGGLDAERFTLHFPFSFRHQRAWFDRAVAVQRRLNVRRRSPDGLVPHLGSQWWCLSRETLEAIAADPEGPAFRRYFSGVWIPDESYFQTMVRRHGRVVHSRSLTFNRFDHQGKPTVFYDDHLRQMEQLDAFFIRKVWHGADRLYRHFLAPDLQPAPALPEVAGRFLRLIEASAQHRTEGRRGVMHAGRFPAKWETPAPFGLLHAGPVQLQAPAMTTLGRLFAQDAADAMVRDHAPSDYLRNALRGLAPGSGLVEYAARDLEPLLPGLATAETARVFHVRHAWVLALENEDIATAQALLESENALLKVLTASMNQDHLFLADWSGFLREPKAALAPFLGSLGLPPGTVKVSGLPDVDAVAARVERLRDAGLPLPAEAPMAVAAPGLRVAL